MTHPLPLPPWSNWLAIYFVALGLASGITLVDGLLRLDANERSRALELRASYVSLVVLAITGAVLVVDLGRPARFWLMLAGFPNLLSPMAWGARLLALKSVLLVGQTLMLRKGLANQAPGDVAEVSPLLVVTRRLLLVVSLALAIYPAFLLSRTWLSPLSRIPTAGFLFLVTALLLGVAAWSVLVTAWPEPRIKARLVRAMNVLLALELAGLGLQWMLAQESPASGFVREALQTRDAALCAFAIGASWLLWLAGRLALARWRHVTALNAAAIAVGAVGIRYLLFAVR